MKSEYGLRRAAIHARLTERLKGRHDTFSLQIWTSSEALQDPSFRAQLAHPSRYYTAGVLDGQCCLCRYQNFHFVEASSRTGVHLDSAP